MAKTYYQTSTAEASGVHVAANEFRLATATGTGTSTETVKKNDDELSFCFTTASGEPNTTDWPSGTYDAQLDVNAAGADLTYGFKTIGASAGHFARVNAALTSDLDTDVQTEGTFSGTGLKYASCSGLNATAGATDRFEILLAVANAHTKDGQDLTLNHNDTDAYATGPWSAGSATVPAAVATATGTANAATVAAGSVNVAAAVASGTGTGNAATVAPGSVNVPAAAATATGTANAATVKIIATVPAAVASATGTAPSATVAPGSVSVAAGVATGTGTGNAATVAPGSVNVAAAVASGTGTGNAADATIITTVPAAVASAVGTANPPTVSTGSVSVAAAVASATGTGNAATVHATVSVPAAVASATGTAPNATVQLSGGTQYVDAAVASSTASSAAATVAPGSVTVPAAAATATGTAPNADATVAQTAVAQVASATGTGNAATVSVGSVSVPAAAATATGTGNAATVAPGSVSMAAAVASGTGTAPDAGASLGAATQYVDAAVASATGTAGDAVVSLISRTRYEGNVASNGLGYQVAAGGPYVLAGYSTTDMGFWLWKRNAVTGVLDLILEDFEPTSPYPVGVANRWGNQVACWYDEANSKLQIAVGATGDGSAYSNGGGVYFYDWPDSGTVAGDMVELGRVLGDYAGFRLGERLTICDGRCIATCDGAAYNDIMFMSRSGDVWSKDKTKSYTGINDLAPVDLWEHPDNTGSVLGVIGAQDYGVSDGYIYVVKSTGPGDTWTDETSLIPPGSAFQTGLAAAIGPGANGNGTIAGNYKQNPEGVAIWDRVTDSSWTYRGHITSGADDRVMPESLAVGYNLIAFGDNSHAKDGLGRVGGVSVTLHDGTNWLTSTVAKDFMQPEPFHGNEDSVVDRGSLALAYQSGGYIRVITGDYGWRPGPPIGSGLTYGGIIEYQGDFYNWTYPVRAAAASATATANAATCPVVPAGEIDVDSSVTTNVCLYSPIDDEVEITSAITEAVCLRSKIPDE